VADNKHINRIQQNKKVAKMFVCHLNIIPFTVNCSVSSQQSRNIYTLSGGFFTNAMSQAILKPTNKQCQRKAASTTSKQKQSQHLNTNFYRSATEWPNNDGIIYKSYYKLAENQLTLFSSQIGALE